MRNNSLFLTQKNGSYISQRKEDRVEESQHRPEALVHSALQRGNHNLQ